MSQVTRGRTECERDQDGQADAQALADRAVEAPAAEAPAVEAPAVVAAADGSQIVRLLPLVRGQQIRTHQLVVHSGLIYINGLVHCAPAEGMQLSVCRRSLILSRRPHLTLRSRR